jgi:hypothetical protein
MLRIVDGFEDNLSVRTAVIQQSKNCLTLEDGIEILAQKVST